MIVGGSHHHAGAQVLWTPTYSLTRFSDQAHKGQMGNPGSWDYASQQGLLHAGRLWYTMGVEGGLSRAQRPAGLDRSLGL